MPAMPTTIVQYGKRFGTIAEEVVARAGRLVCGLEEAGIARENMFIDPMIQPISTDTTKGLMAMDAVRSIRAAYPQVHTVCGLSNISYGLPHALGSG